MRICPSALLAAHRPDSAQSPQRVQFISLCSSEFRQYSGNPATALILLLRDDFNWASTPALRTDTVTSENASAQSGLCQIVAPRVKYCDLIGLKA